MSLASVSIVGNLTKSPALTRLPSGTAKTTLTVAVNSLRKENKDTADFYHVEVWGRLAELTVQYLNKGHQITASGRLSFDRWTDREGRSRVTPVIRAEQIAFPRKAMVNQTGMQGGDVDMAKDRASFTGSSRNLKSSAGDYDVEQETVNDQEIDPENESDEIEERVKGAFFGSEPLKSERATA